MKMALQQSDLGDPVTLLLLIIAIILVAFILYLGARLIAGKKETETGYIIRLLMIAFIIVILVAVVVGAIVRSVSSIAFVRDAAAQIVPVLIYLAIVFLVKYLLIPEKAETTKWNASIWIALLTLFLIFLVNVIGLEFFPDQPLIDAGI